jgi:hypothetical protein
VITAELVLAAIALALAVSAAVVTTVALIRGRQNTGSKP